MPTEKTRNGKGALPSKLVLRSKDSDHLDLRTGKTERFEQAKKRIETLLPLESLRVVRIVDPLHEERIGQFGGEQRPAVILSLVWASGTVRAKPSRRHRRRTRRILSVPPGQVIQDIRLFLS